MGLRRALLRWLTSDDEVRDLLDRREAEAAGPATGSDGVTGEPAGWASALGGDRWSTDPSTAAATAPGPHTVPPQSSDPTALAGQPTGPAAPPVAGGLVVGQAEHRLPPLELPKVYVAPPAPLPAPTWSVQHADYDPAALREAWLLVSERREQLVSSFYAELFLRLPEAPRMFPSSMSRQRQEFGRALLQWVVADDPDSMTAHLDQLGADHRKFDVEPHHYEIAGAALVSAWKRLAGSAWTPAHESAVVGSYMRLASTMIDGAIRRLNEPASWGAQVIEHRRVLRDFAVLRVQPDAPYPYKAGQYVTVEVPSHRRQWRQMSIASAPRADNTFDLHVRAIGGSGVSAALVMHTRPGDRLRLGPPRGNDLVLEPGTVNGGVLCVSSGTGAAPITAVVESILGWSEPPSQLYAFVGGRTRHDIYPVDQLNQLIARGGSWHRAHVHGVVSDDPGYVGYRGKVENVVPTLQDWGRLGVDVLIAGPSPMIATTIDNLTAVGVPREKIHFDQYEVAA